MNERIKELADKAFAHFTNTNTWSTSNEFCEKFAELIVEEMYCFMCDATDNDKPWPSFKEVKQHFGVEE